MKRETFSPIQAQQVAEAFGNHEVELPQLRAFREYYERTRRD